MLTLSSHTHLDIREAIVPLDLQINIFYINHFSSLSSLSISVSDSIALITFDEGLKLLSLYNKIQLKFYLSALHHQLNEQLQIQH
jgi:hypothetical protein